MNSWSDQNLGRLTHFLSFRSKVFHNLKEQIHHQDSHVRYSSMSDKSSQDHLLFLMHLFSGLPTNDATSEDLLNFYNKGSDCFNAYIKCIVLREPGSKLPSRKRVNLKTFSARKKTATKERREIADQRLQISCLRRQLALSKSSQERVQELNQFISLPRGICDPNGIQLKHAKATIAKVYQDNYPEAFSSVVDLDPQSSVAYIVDGMFTIQTSPWDLHKTFRDYILHLYRVWVFFPMAAFHAREVHIAFDHPHRHGVSPKDVERGQRDSKQKSAMLDEEYTSLSLDTKLPKPCQWRAFLANRTLSVG